MHKKYILYRYQFFANTTGTHFWHAHTGAQKMDGIFGSFVVRETEKQDVHSHLYDFDLANHVMLVNDWFTEETTSRFPGRKIGVKQHLPESFFINGKGRYTVNKFFLTQKRQERRTKKFRKGLKQLRS